MGVLKNNKTRTSKNKSKHYQKNLSVNLNNVKIFILILLISLVVNFNLFTKNTYLESSISELKKGYKNEIVFLENDYTNYLFLGDSITDYYDLDKYYEGLPVVNSGISGNTTEDILNDMKARVYNYNPSKVFLLIGTNDLVKDTSVDDIVSNIEKIISEINANKPQTEVYVESIYPVNDNINEDVVSNRNNKDITKINNQIKKYCEYNNCTYINMYDKLLDDDNNFNEEYTDDGLHPNSKGYEVITKELKKYLN